MIKLPIDPRRELWRWGPIKLKVLYMAYFMEDIWHGVPKCYQWPWPPIIFIFNRGYGVGMMDYRALKAVGDKYFRRYFLNPKNFARHWVRYESWISDYESFADQVNALKLRELSNQALAKLYHEFRQLNYDFWLIVHVPEMANWGGEAMLLRALRQIDPLRAETHLEVLAAPTKPSFFQEEEMELLRLAAKTTRANLPEALREHARRYAWILNSYAGNRRLGPTYFLVKLRELTRERSAARVLQSIKIRLNAIAYRKRALARQLRISPQVRRMAEMLGEAVFWHDDRKGYIWRLQHTGDPILHEIARRRGWNFEELLWCLPEEVARLALGHSLNKKDVLRRRGDYVMIYGQRIGREHYGAAAKKICAMYKTKTTGQQEVKGLVVSRSLKLVRGTVRLVRDPLREVGKMWKGDILVAAMTSPEYIVVMRKAAAIVTDHGGMTSHAAVVSRELGVPCIVNTKHATSVFKDGDLVEVDTKNSIVRKLS